MTCKISKWRVLPSESLFMYTGKTYDDYNIENFVPNLIPPDISKASKQAQLLCGESLECLYDFITTGSATVANHTKCIIEEFNKIVKGPMTIKCQDDGKWNNTEPTKCLD
ncbi:unnamed protein product [Oppiella nova]|uniref:Mucin-4-like C8-3 domain-containing protein n=1 Tax=Oppiella nova TaxID=334625 RepID=A0A7R9LQ27_9ACAR|nr:unnamed protein product [Oppiella nova]CAG2165842.1 unnamed protein product [Oppiella nova]